MNALIIGKDAAGTNRPVLVNEDGSLSVGLTVDGADITLGTVGIDQTTPNANEVVVIGTTLPTGAATEATLSDVAASVAAGATASKQDTGNGTLSTINGKITACDTDAVTVLSSTLPSGAATAAKQPALGTAGSASADVITVQGIASGTAQPISGTVTTTPPTATLSSPVSDYEASRVISAAACKLVMLCGYNAGPSQWIQLFNSATVPANNAVPVLSYGIPTQSSFQIPIPVSGLPLSTGLSWSNSSTGNKKTIGSDDCFVTVVII